MLRTHKKRKKEGKLSNKTLLVIHSYDEQSLLCVNVILFRVTISDTHTIFYNWKNLYIPFRRIVIDMETFDDRNTTHMIEIIRDRVDVEKNTISFRYDITILYKLHLISLLLPMDIISRVIYFLSFAKSIKIDFT